MGNYTPGTPLIFHQGQIANDTSYRFSRHARHVLHSRLPKAQHYDSPGSSVSNSFRLKAHHRLTDKQKDFARTVALDHLVVISISIGASVLLHL